MHWYANVAQIEVTIGALITQSMQVNTVDCKEEPINICIRPKLGSFFEGLMTTTITTIHFKLHCM